MEDASGPSLERRDLLRLLAPLVPLGLIYFIYTDAHRVLRVVLNVDGAALLLLAGTLMLCWFLLLRKAPRGIGENWRGLLWIVAIILQGLAAMFTLVAMFLSPVPGEVVRRPVPGRGTVAILYSSVLQGQEATLAQVVFDLPLLHVYLPLVVTATDSPHVGSDLVRPEGHGQGNGWQIHVAPNGMFTGFYGGTLCVLAWDPETGRTWGTTGSPVDRLPPFLLIGEESGLMSDDVECMVRKGVEECRTRKRYAQKGTSTSPPDPLADACLRNALSHPNPAVRAAARRIVDAGGPEVYPEASKVPR